MPEGVQAVFVKEEAGQQGEDRQERNRGQIGVYPNQNLLSAKDPIQRARRKARGVDTYFHLCTKRGALAE